MGKKFQLRYLILATVFNGLVVFFINLSEGGNIRAGGSGMVQLWVSASMAGFSIPYAVTHAVRPKLALALFHSSFVMATAVMLWGLLWHWLFSTPELFGTTVWNFSLNATAGLIIVYLKRNMISLPPLLRKIAQKL